MKLDHVVVEIFQLGSISLFVVKNKHKPVNKLGALAKETT